MNTFYYTPTYTNKRTIDVIPKEIIDKFGDSSISMIEKQIPDNVLAQAEEIKRQKQQAIAMREYMEKKGLEKSSFI